MSSANKFDKDYYERGVELGVSLYTNYHYMPERSRQEAKAVISNLGLDKEHTILDFGCAKGFLVKALVELGYDAYGTDISKYAISHCEPEIDHRIFILCDSIIKNRRFDYGFCKDVLEHSEDLDTDLSTIAKLSSRWLVCIPLADNGNYRIEDYEKDTTHLIRENEAWWIRMFEKHFQVISRQYRLAGLKDKWYDLSPKGNMFVRMRKKHETKILEQR